MQILSLMMCDFIHEKHEMSEKTAHSTSKPWSGIYKTHTHLQHLYMPIQTWCYNFLSNFRPTSSHHILIIQSGRSANATPTSKLLRWHAISCGICEFPKHCASVSIRFLSCFYMSLTKLVSAVPNPIFPIRCSAQGVCAVGSQEPARGPRSTGCTGASGAGPTACKESII